ncbi:ATPase [Candidatus Heimdallarchaeota archaeon B3_Heim]|nr:MAG: ATPase [Candidatus Heimdallarchaeota archaeon B3_Heim]
MKIKKIRVTNFKSFKDVKVDLEDISVVIGANASGKSNFIQIFKFLSDIANFGLCNALSMQGDVEFVRNIKIGSSENLNIRITGEFAFRTFGRSENTEDVNYYGLEASEFDYEFSLGFNGKNGDFSIVKDSLTLNCRLNELIFKPKDEEEGFTLQEEKPIGSCELILFQRKGKLSYELIINEEEIRSRVGIISIAGLEKEMLQGEVPFQSLLIENPHIFRGFANLDKLFRSISIYDFDPKLPKNAVPFTGKRELEPNGSNLAIVLNNILQDKEKERKFINLITDLLPFIKNYQVEKFADKYLMSKYCEKYSVDHYFPASLMSDGTINITALIVALIFDEKPFIIIEEPERNIHPFLISKILNIIREASEKKQIIITSHNPELVRNADLNSILLIARDEEGFSIIKKPQEKEEVKIFLKNEIGIEELFVQNLLG